MDAEEVVSASSMVDGLSMMDIQVENSFLQRARTAAPSSRADTRTGYGIGRMIYGFIRDTEATNRSVKDIYPRRREPYILDSLSVAAARDLRQAVLAPAAAIQPRFTRPASRYQGISDLTGIDTDGQSEAPQTHSGGHHGKAHWTASSTACYGQCCSLKTKFQDSESFKQRRNPTLWRFYSRAISHRMSGLSASYQERLRWICQSGKAWLGTWTAEGALAEAALHPVRVSCRLRFKAALSGADAIIEETPIALRAFIAFKCEHEKKGYATAKAFVQLSRITSSVFMVAKANFGSSASIPRSGRATRLPTDFKVYHESLKNATTHRHNRAIPPDAAKGHEDHHGLSRQSRKLAKASRDRAVSIGKLSRRQRSTSGPVPMSS
ncbi:hypothetical protein HGRIS_001546 [Hohenbuehelia grisea]|uniref:Uncharacterized protein n=1 Tax=Hohenbuehelia grisea TaxID=104357 RepID=A0ABR3JPN2_9AGAR